MNSQHGRSKSNGQIGLERTFCAFPSSVGMVIKPVILAPIGGPSLQAAKAEVAFITVRSPSRRTPPILLLIKPIDSLFDAGEKDGDRIAVTI